MNWTELEAFLDELPRVFDIVSLTPDKEPVDEEGSSSYNPPHGLISMTPPASTP